MTRRKPRTVAEGWVPNRHGIISSYIRGCRCDACRAANTERSKRVGYSRTTEARRRAERVEINGRLVHPDPYGGHGSISAYTSCGCRCDACRGNWNERRKAQRAMRRAGGDA